MDRSIARQIARLARKSQTHIGNILKKYNLTAAEQPFFMALAHHEGVTQERLTALVGVDKAATARAVKSLEEKGFLIRVQDEKDRRQNRIYSTEAANQLRSIVTSELFVFNDQLTQGIDPQDLEVIHAGLKKMAENLFSIVNGKSTEANQDAEEETGQS